MKKQVLLAMPYEDYDPADSKAGLRLLQENDCEVTLCDHYLNDDEILKIADQYDAIIYCGGFSPNEKFFASAKRMKILSRLGVGFDEIDLDAAKRYGKQVTITRVDEHVNGVAELAYALMMSMLYHIPQRYSEYVIEKKYQPIVENRQLRGKTVGLFGFGAIAKTLARHLQSDGVKLLAYDMFPDMKAAKELNVTMVEKEQLLSESDIISIHVPGMPENRKMFCSETFQKMKDGAFLINTARGMLVDEEALYEALKSKKLAGAAVDVMDLEPADPENPLFSLPGFIATPHIGGHNFEAREAMQISAAQAVVDSLNGKKPFFLLR